MNPLEELRQPGNALKVMLRAKRQGDLLLAMEADAIAVLDRTRTTGRAALLPSEDIVANDVAFKRLSDSLRRTA